MARKPTDIAQLKLRLPERLRHEIEREARKSGRSLNGELVYRLVLSFQQSDLQDMIRTVIASTAEQAVDVALDRLKTANPTTPPEITKSSEDK